MTSTAKNQTVSVQLTPNVAEDKMSAYTERDINMLLAIDVKNGIFDFSQFGRSFYAYFMGSNSSPKKQLRKESTVKELNSNFDH
jgi:hypothetical protein